MIRTAAEVRDEILDRLKLDGEFWHRVNEMPRREQIRAVYKIRHDDIMGQSRRGRFIDPYFFDWDADWKLSPPERSAWAAIRGYYIPLYPQYPVLQYFVDYGDPYRKIAVEIDGKAFHDPEKDKLRDERLWEIGWRTFRIPAKETYGNMFQPGEWFCSTPVDEQRKYLSKWIKSTADGFIFALRAVYYRNLTSKQHAFCYGIDESLAEHLWNLQMTTLSSHRLIDFPLTKEDEEEEAELLRI